MPKAKKQDKITHISRVVFEGYKSIDHLEIDLVKGLNIIIGPNGSGKSNFLALLNNTWNWFINSPFISPVDKYHTSEITLFTKNNLKIGWYSEMDTKSNKWEIEKGFYYPMLTEEVTVNDKVISSKGKGKKEDLPASYEGRLTLRSLNVLPTPFILLKYDIPNTFFIADAPGNIEFTKYSLGSNISPFQALGDFIMKVIHTHYASNFESVAKILDKEDFLNKLKMPELMLENLGKHSPIKNVRISPNINIYKTNKKLTIENLVLEFFIEGQWMPWSYLSDGTKRLFYLISEISYFEDAIILIEEPELGVHPDQFHLIMSFLKEQAEDKQIIMSTHSPEALNIFNENELGNIILTKYDKKKGTTMSHLNNKQIAKAKAYMKELDLSDYWLASDLEG